jgi:hypothetical protein
MAAVAKFSEPDSDAGDGTQDLLDRVAAVRAGCGGRRMQAECPLSVSDEGGQIGLIVDRLAGLSWDHLGGAFDQFLCAANSQCRVVDDGALDAGELLADRGGVLEVDERAAGGDMWVATGKMSS